jgi:hypothetical protein
MKKFLVIIIIILIAIGIGILAYILSPETALIEEETAKVKIFFSNIEETPEMLDCSKIFPVERVIFVGEGENSAVLTTKALLEGPTEEEIVQGYLTNINSGTELIGLNTENGVATANFSQRIEEGVGGSCMVTAIRAQITETLIQFPEIDEVIIAVEGKTEEILQP